MAGGEIWIVAGEPPLRSQFTRDVQLIPVIGAVDMEERLGRQQLVDWKRQRDEHKLQKKNRKQRGSTRAPRRYFARDHLEGIPIKPVPTRSVAAGCSSRRLLDTFPVGPQSF